MDGTFEGEELCQSRIDRSHKLPTEKEFHWEPDEIKTECCRRVNCDQSRDENKMKKLYSQPFHL